MSVGQPIAKATPQSCYRRRAAGLENRPKVKYATSNQGTFADFECGWSYIGQGTRYGADVFQEPKEQFESWHWIHGVDIPRSANRTLQICLF